MNETSEQATTARIGVLTVSDRASRGEYQDTNGPAIQSYLRGTLTSPWEPVTRVIPDVRPQVEAALRKMADMDGCCLVITNGGTGPAIRDVTVDATLAVCNKLLPGFGEVMRAVSLRSVPTAILSRQTAGIRGRTLVVNLPGSPKAIDECLDAVFAAIPDCLALMGWPRLETNTSRVKAYEPHAS